MTADVVAGIVALLLAVIGGSVGWDQVKRHGAETERRKQAEGKVDAAQARVEASDAAPASRMEASGILRRRLERLSRRLRAAREGRR